ncbi:9587_t:CDS:2 [Dentiscutata erythropus]|uniref:9587_t:CDS:1 n=1 Tax=Dentiscutata erythropus TaxID=1348616 RepID=A0A9N9DU83_9GLOM|nr:9587_t:CDS:2 [Dentiscutata erythropus]
MSSKQKNTLSDAQKHELCFYAHDNKLTHAKYIVWIEEKWSIRVYKSTITQILQTKDKRLTTEIVNPEKKRNRAITVPALSLLLRNFLFQEWLRDFDQEILKKHKGRSVLLFLDNCSSHKTDGLFLQNVEICFLSKNTTSKIQPMDARIIMSFKRNYYHHHIQWMLDEIESGKNIQDLKIDILQGIKYIIQGWNENEKESLEEPLLEELSKNIEDLNFSDPMQVEEETFRERPDEIENEDLEEADDRVEKEIIKPREAFKSLDNIRTFLLQQEDANKYIKLVNIIKKFITTRKNNSMT